MALIFSLRGPSLTPRFTKGNKLNSSFLALANLAVPPVVSALGDASVFGGQAINLVLTNNDTRSQVYTTGKNWVDGTRVFSFRIRMVPNFSGNPSSNFKPVYIGSDPNNPYGGFFLHFLTDGTINIRCLAGYDGGTTFINRTTSALTFVSGVATDIMFTCDGTNVYASQDGVEVLNAAVNDTQASSVFDQAVASKIVLAVYPSNIYVNEVNIWDTCEPHVYAPRTDFLICADVDASVSVDPGIANVELAQTYQINGVDLVGTLNLPAEDDVRLGVSYDNGALVGLLDLPAEADVLTGVDFDNGTQTGTLIPATMTEAVLIGEGQLDDSVTVLEFTQGDTPTLNLEANVGEDTPYDLTGAVFTSYLKSTDDTAVPPNILTIPNAQHTADPDQAANRGKFTLALTAADTALIKAASGHELVTRVVQGGNTIYFHGRNLITVYKNTPVA